MGKYSGRGGKGQTARSGVSGLKKLGMKSLILSMAKKRGFQSGRVKPLLVQVGDIAQMFTKETNEVTPETLKKVGLVSASAVRIKILNGGEISFPVTIRGCAISASAKQKILSAGGVVN
jgi:large subunit ribosomal protein L15